jgi:hypothetical protein
MALPWGRERDLVCREAPVREEWLAAGGRYGGSMKRFSLLLCASICGVGAALAAQPKGKDLFALCTSSNQQEIIGCNLYIAGFIHGFGARDDLKEEPLLCLPQGLTAWEAVAVYIRVMKEMQAAAKSGTGSTLAENPFFEGDQTAALTAALGLQYPCKKK